MSAEIMAVISGIVNVIGVLAGIFGWRKYKKVERVAETVIKGVEATAKVLKSDEVKVVKKMIQGVAHEVGNGGDVDKMVQKLTK